MDFQRRRVRGRQPGVDVVKRVLGSLRRVVTPALCAVATCAVAALVWLTTGSWVTTAVAAIAAMSVLAIMVIGLTRNGRAVRVLAQRTRSAQRDQATELSRVLYHARRGADAAVVVHQRTGENKDAAVNQALASLATSAAELSAKVSAQQEAAPPRTAVDRDPRVRATTPRVSSLKGPSALPNDWAIMRQFDLLSAAPHSVSASALRVRTAVSDDLARKLAKAAVVDRRGGAGAANNSDVAIVSDVAATAELGTHPDAAQILEVMVARLLSLAPAPQHAATVAWLETDALGPSEIEYLSSLCDVVVRPSSAGASSARNHIVCDELLDLRALDARREEAGAGLNAGSVEAGVRALLHGDEDQSDDGFAARILAALLGASVPGGGAATDDVMGVMRSSNLWTPATLMSRLGELVGQPQPNFEAATVVSAVSSEEEARIAFALFEETDRSVLQRQVLVTTGAVPPHRTMALMRRYGTGSTIVASHRELMTPEGRHGLIETAYAIVAPPALMPSLTRVRSGLVAAEVPELPIALVPGSSSTTLVDPAITPLLMSSANALKAALSTDGLVPARILGMS